MSTVTETRKHRQSYRHADPRRQWPQVAQDWANQLLPLTTVHCDGFHNRVTLTLSSGSMHTERLL